jgi:hypothetical protein
MRPRARARARVRAWAPRARERIQGSCQIYRGVLYSITNYRVMMAWRSKWSPLLRREE